MDPVVVVVVVVQEGFSKACGSVNSREKETKIGFKKRGVELQEDAALGPLRFNILQSLSESTLHRTVNGSRKREKHVGKQK